MPDAATLAGQPAEVGIRFVARLVDGVVLVLVAVPAVLVGVLPGDTAGGALAVGLLGYVYSAALDATGGTLGKRLLRLAVVGARPRPGVGAGATRNVWLLTSLLPGLVGQSVALAVSVLVAGSIARHPVERGWHDRLAGTAVRRPS